MFTRAIVRLPSDNLAKGLSSSNLGEPDYDRALYQHARYVAALRACGLEVTVLRADEAFPDSTFIEDTALLTHRCAILTNPGAPSRRGEVEGVEEVLREFYETIERIESPATVDGGDIMKVRSHFYIGLSGRTNHRGAEQTIAALTRHGMTGSVVPVNGALHLKTGVSYLENGNLVAAGEMIEKPQFQRYNIIPVDPDEAHAANCLWINGTVLVPLNCPRARRAIETAGYETRDVDVSEFGKMDGGLSCLSLRF